MDGKKLEELSQVLAEMDREILRSIERRARLVQDIVKARSASDQGIAAKFAPITDGRHLIELEKSVTPPLPASAVRPIFAAIDSACRMFEVAPSVAFIGAEGGFGWMAAQSHFGPTAEYCRAETTAAALDEVARSRADFAVVPYESVKEGPVFPTIQAIGAADLQLVGEREFSQSLSLLNKTGNPADVEKIYVAPQHHVLCVEYIESNHPRALVLDVRSSIMAWELASENHGSSAIVPSGLVGTNDLQVARENIGDDGEVRIRYGIISRLPVPRSGADATGILFSVHDRPGALHDILEHFKERNCNLRRIQSRPVPGPGWEYVFYVEVSGHMTDRALVAALDGVKRKAKMVKIIGSFPLESPDPPEPSHR
jgi:chorismate mutase / prephenate dehydratase